MSHWEKKIPFVLSSYVLALNVDELISVLLAQQLPPLPKYSGESDDKESVIGTFHEWLEQFKMIIDVCNRSPRSKLVNLTTRLCNQASACFFTP